MISIIIPVYNAEKYIIQCLESIKQQNVDLEVICVDDGSTDRSRLLIDKYSRENSFVKYIYQDNAGAPAARNNGLSIAVGDYCMFFDSDDILFPGALKSMLSAIDSSNADIVLGNYWEIDESGMRTKLIEQRAYIPNMSNRWYFSLCPPLPGNKLIRKKVLDCNGIKFEPLKIGQDLNFYLRLLAVINKIVYLQHAVMGYRIVQGSISRQYSLKILDICNSVDNIKEYYKELGKSIEYKKYISIVELIAYRSQLSKIRFFKKSDRKKIVHVLWNRIRCCNVPDAKLLKIYIKERIKCIIIIIISSIGCVRKVARF